MQTRNDEPATTWWAAPLGRRSLLRGSLLGGVGLAAAALIGCGGGDDDDDDTGSAAPSGGASGGDSTAASTSGSDSDTGSDDSATDGGDDAEETGRGMLIRDPDLPYPYQFPEPAGKAPKSGGTLRVAVTFDVVTFDPTLSAAGGTITIPNMVYNKLLGMVGGVDKDPFAIELKPELASSWERTPDGSTFTFAIREGVKWQNVAPLNGRDLVAQDLKFAFDRYAAEGVHKSYWRNISSTETPDDYTFTATMGTVTADFILPIASRYQTIFPRETVDDGTIGQVVVGTGPMILTEAEQGSHINFVKNPAYFEREPFLDGAEFRVMTDQNARLAAFRVGQLDYAYSIARTKPDLEQLLKTNPDVQINLQPVVNGSAFGINLSNPKFADDRVRQAMALAIDQDLIEELVYDNLATTLPLHPWVFVFDEQPSVESGLMGPWMGRTDPDEARKLLQAAGAEGLSFGSIYYRYGDYVQEQTEIILKNFADVGLDMNARSVDYTEFNSTWVPGKLEETSTSAWLTVGFDADNFFYNSVHSTSPGNRWQLSDPQIDAWAEEQQVEIDPDARREIIRKMWDHIQEKMYYPPIPSAIGIEVYQPWLRGLRWGGIFYSNGSYYDWGHQMHEAWLDK